MCELAAKLAAMPEDEKSELEGAVEAQPAVAPVSAQIGPAETPYGVGDYMWPGRPNLVDEVVAGLDASVAYDTRNFTSDDTLQISHTPCLLCVSHDRFCLGVGARR